MKKHLLIRGLVAVVVLLCVTASAHAFLGPRGDFKVLSNDKSGAVVRAWVLNTGCGGRFALVTVVARATDGRLVQGAYTVWVPAHTSRPVDVFIGSQITFDPTIIVSGLGG